jgi:hypothetical protein
MLYSGAIEQNPYFSLEDLERWVYETCALALPGTGGLSNDVLHLDLRTQGDDFTTITTEHIQDVTMYDTLYPAMKAGFSSTINRRAGLLSAEYNFGPAYEASRKE